MPAIRNKRIIYRLFRNKQTCLVSLTKRTSVGVRRNFVAGNCCCVNGVGSATKPLIGCNMLRAHCELGQEAVDASALVELSAKMCRRTSWLRNCNKQSEISDAVLIAEAQNNVTILWCFAIAEIRQCDRAIQPALRDIEHRSPSSIRQAVYHHGNIGS